MTSENRRVFLRPLLGAVAKGTGHSHRMSFAGSLTRAAAVAAVGLAALVAGAPTAAAGPPAAAIRWQLCPTYSDDALRVQGIRPERMPEYRALLARLECGTVSVPLDYHHRQGRQISVAVTRLPATDQAHRLGSIALNPGGPGGSGYLMPITASLAKALSLTSGTI
jgi:hypothetical protein